ncbi:MAG: SIMPL domain-containing protein [Novosphingobium sp.]
MNTLNALSLPAIALAALASPAQAAKNDTSTEVTLHIDADAAIPPDRAEIVVPISGTGATEAAARQDLKARQDMLVRELQRTGLDGAAITTGAANKIVDRNERAGLSEMSVETEVACDAAMARATKTKGAKAAEAPEECIPKLPAFAFQSTITVTINDLAKLDALQSAASAQGIPTYRFGNGVHYLTSDPAAAAKAAREQAIAKARRDADDYAASLGYHVVRIVRVSNTSPAFSMSDLHKLTTYADMAPSRMTPSYFASATYVTVGIDFVIAPN